MKKVLLLFLLFTIHCSLYTAKAQCTAVSITTQPQNQNDSIPGAAHFNVAVTGTAPFNYYWYVNGVVVDSTVNSGSSSNTNNTPPLIMVDSNNTFYCVITNCGGLNSVTSTTAYLICIPVSISIQPLSQTFTAGVVTTISFSVTVNGTPPFSYYWYRNPGTLVKTTIDTVGHTSVYTFYANPVVYGMNGNAYHVVITNHCSGGGGGQLVSNNTVLTVTCPTMAAPPIYCPFQCFSCGDGGINLSTTSVAGATYNWGPNNAVYSGYNTPSVNMWIFGNPWNGTCSETNYYSLSVTVNGCTSPTASYSAIGYTPPQITNTPSNQTICSGSTVSYIPSVSCGSIQYIFHSASSCINGFATSYNGIINDVLINSGAVPCTVTYSIYLTNSYCTSYTFLTNFTITVNPTPNVTVNSPTICTGDTATITGNGAISYTWSAGADSISVNMAEASPAATSTYTVTGTNIYGCTNTAASTVTVLSSLNSSITQVADTLVCNMAGATYQWYSCQPIGLVVISGAINQSYTPVKWRICCSSYSWELCGYFGMCVLLCSGNK